MYVVDETYKLGTTIIEEKQGIEDLETILEYFGVSKE